MQIGSCKYPNKIIEQGHWRVDFRPGAILGFKPFRQCRGVRWHGTHSQTEKGKYGMTYSFGRFSLDLAERSRRAKSQVQTEPLDCCFSR